MLNYSEMLRKPPFSMSSNEKEKWYLKNQKILCKFHYSKCAEYKNIVDRLNFNLDKISNLNQIPFIPARLFKEINLKSSTDENIAITLTSSGTSGSNVSKVQLDRKTSLLQSRVLNKIFSTVLPSKKIPMFFCETNSSNKSNIITARVAATRGFTQFVSETNYILDQNLNLSLDKLISFIENNRKEPFLIFGFTSVIWTNLVLKLREKKIYLPKNKGILIHGGGWKKILDQAVDKHEYNTLLKKTLGVSNVYNYYGMVEQTGSIFLECSEGFYHPSIFSDVIIRDKNLEVARYKQEGLIQVFSLLPQSYPGQSILTEDIGSLIGKDNCKCERKGKYFTVKGRVEGVELRGCSDT